MVRKLFKYIFIYILLVGCDIQNPVAVAYGGECNNCNCYELEISAPSLEKDFFGKYQLEYVNGYSQTFSTLHAETNGAGVGQYIYFDTDKRVEWPAGSGTTWSSINHHSYTHKDGTTSAVFAAWESMIGHTTTVTATWTDVCGYTHTDKIKIVVVDKE